MPVKLRIGCAIAALCLLAACEANTYNRIETGGVERTSAKLDRTGAILITRPDDGTVGGKPGSISDIVTRTLDASFSRYAAIVDTTPAEYHFLARLSNSVTLGDYSYIIVPSIAHWPAQAGHWSRLPPEVAVKITVLDAATGHPISSNYLESKAPPRDTLMSNLNFDSENPADMLGNMIDDYVDALYGFNFWGVIK